MPRQRQQAAQNTGFNSAACAVELHEPARVDEPVHDSRRHLVVAEHGHPLAELYVGRDDHALPALRHRHHLEQQPRAAIRPCSRPKSTCVTTPSCSAASRWTNPRASRSSAGSPFLARSTPPTSPTPPRPRRNEPGHSVR